MATDFFPPSSFCCCAPREAVAIGGSLATATHAAHRCCYSSGVEHSLGKGEAESSNLSSSTIFPFEIVIGFRTLVDQHATLSDAVATGSPEEASLCALCNPPETVRKLCNAGIAEIFVKILVMPPLKFDWSKGAHHELDRENSSPEYG